MRKILILRLFWLSFGRVKLKFLLFLTNLLLIRFCPVPSALVSPVYLPPGSKGSSKNRSKSTWSIFRGFFPGFASPEDFLTWERTITWLENDIGWPPSTSYPVKMKIFSIQKLKTKITNSKIQKNFPKKNLNLRDSKTKIMMFVPR